MIHHNDQTMDVRINGKIEQRPIDHVERHGGMGGMPRAHPILLEGEEAMWFVGELIPTIVQCQIRAQESWDASIGGGVDGWPN